MDAISVGYRMIDTAQAYLNEEAVGKAWKKSGVRREYLFLVNKVWHSNYGEGQTMKSVDESLRKLQTTTSTSCSFTSHSATAMVPIATWRKPIRLAKCALSE